MRDRDKNLTAKIDRELKFIRFCELNNFSAERAYERLARIENELYVRRKLTLERIQSENESSQK